MADKPIPFSAPMVRALLDGRKTQTRRVLCPACDEPPAYVAFGQVTALDENDTPYRWPRTYAVGDQLYVREAWRADAVWDACMPSEFNGSDATQYEADGSIYTRLWGDPFAPGRYRHARFMPRWASRMTLIVTDVRVQRLQDIAEEDARAEGVEPLHQGYFPYGITTFATTFVGDREVPAQYCATARESFERLWNSLHGPEAWDANPWVVALTFTAHRQNIDQMKEPRDGQSL